MTKATAAETELAGTGFYPLRFVPILEYRPWGGRRLAEFLSTSTNRAGLLDKLLRGERIGEAWVLSDRDDHRSCVANGSFTGWSITRLIEAFPEQVMGGLAGQFRRFPLLLKFLDAREMLSVQVHPGDSPAHPVPVGESGKTEAWVVINATSGSRVYAGLKPGTTEISLQRALADGSLTEVLGSFTPNSGDAVFLPAGTVHALGGDALVFEVQQNSDVTFSLYDWGRVDQRTGRPRALQIEEALGAINYGEGQGGLVRSPPATAASDCELLFDCPHFRVWRRGGSAEFPIAAPGVPRILVCLEGSGQIGGDGRPGQGGFPQPVSRGDVFLLPAAIRSCTFRPLKQATTLEIELPGVLSRLIRK